MGLKLESGKIYIRIAVTYVRFIGLTLAGFLKRCWNTWPVGPVFKQLPWDWQMLMHEKICVIPVVVYRFW